MQVAATPRGLPEPGAPPTPEKTLSRWTQFLGSIASGTLLPDAMLKHFITRADIEACIRSGPEERNRWDEAKLAALKRSWSAFDFDDIFAKIAGGSAVSDAVHAVKPGASYSAFNQIIVADSVLNEHYMTALKSRALVMQDEVLEIVDDDSQDVIHNEKGPAPNNAAVNRSKIRAEIRMRLMGAWHTKMFGEAKSAVQVNVQVNHAAKLEEARARANNRTATPKLTGPVIEAAFRDMAPEPEEPSEWDDLPTMTKASEPMDTTWLEN